jgi:hypothetical protein
VPIEDYQCCGATSFMIAAKFMEKQSPCLSSLVYLSMDAFTIEKLKETELHFLDTLDWNIYRDTALDYFDLLCSNIELQFTNEMKEMGTILLLFIQTDKELYKFPMFIMAISCVSCVLLCSNATVNNVRKLLAIYPEKQLIQDCIFQLEFILPHKIPLVF